LPPDVSNEAAVVGLPGKILREEDVREVAEELDRLLSGSDQKALVLDLQGMECPTAGGLAGLVALQKRMQGLGRRLILCNVGDRAYGVFDLVCLTVVLEVRREGVAHKP
jgi:anti-anti-sigma regulatory factor